MHTLSLTTPEVQLLLLMLEIALRTPSHSLAQAPPEVHIGLSSKIMALMLQTGDLN